MKIIYIILGVIILAFIVVQVYAMKGQSGIETYSFKVEKTYETFEIRNYEATLFTMVKLPPSEYKTASGQGFRLLAGYIFGGNEGNEKIAMTSPVAMSLEDSMTMMFMVPKQYKREDLPKPNESQVKFHVEPEKRVAAITFGGWADDEKIEKYKQQLIKSLEAEGIKYTNRFYFLGYNAPYEIANRKNEIIVEL
ncbi:MAG: heme-binding protein [Salibacteraceae bacterium]|nr:heme-binding protein [Salibacteraceae bacterium]